MFRNETKIGYSLALLDIAKDEKKFKDFYKQSSLLVSILEKEEKFIKILDNSNINFLEKQKIIEKVFKGFHWSFINTALILSSKNQFKFFEDILKELIGRLQEILKIKQGIVYSTKLLKPAEIKKLEQKLSKEYQYEVSLVNLIDKELIGGFKIKINSIVIEDSIKLELENMKKTLKLTKGGV